MIVSREESTTKVRHHPAWGDEGREIVVEQILEATT